MNRTYPKQRGLCIALEATLLLVAALLSLTLASVASADTGSEARVSQTKQGAGSQRGTDVFDDITTDERAPLATEKEGKGGNTVASKPRGNDDPQNSVYGDYWIYSVDVDLFSDNDRDGYFYGIDLLFDADTVYAVADVYAVAYLSYEGGPWNEYTVSNDFTLFGATDTDDYVLVTELLTGYPAGSYDLLIELYEADTGVFVASAGPDESFELSGLPLEDADRDLPAPRVTVTSGGGGASGLLFLALLAGAMLGHRR